MSLERSVTRSVPFLPRYRSVSSSRRPRLFPAVRSRSQPSQKIAYCQGNVTKFIAYTRPAHSPSPQRVYLLGVGGKNTKSPLTRLSHSGSSHDLYSSHVYSALECVGDVGEHPQIEVDARATSCGDIYHKGPFYPDATYSESGVSLGESDGSFYGAEDDNASQYSYGSSSAFHEITIDSELDRLDSEDGLKSPREPASWFRFREMTSPDSNRSSPFPYADARKRELMSSPSWEFEKTQSRSNALRVLIPAPDGSLAKERLSRRDSGGSSTPLAQSTPHVSPRSFAGPKLSIKGSWNVDDPYDEGTIFNDTLAAKRMDDSSCYSSFSEDNLSDVSPSKSDKSSRKVKLTKKASDLPAKRSDPNKLSKHGKDQGQKKEKTIASEENLENIYIPPLESVIGEAEESVEAPRDKEGRASWWAVFNIGSANARRDDAENRKSSPEREPKPEIKIVKPAKTGIPLISPGKHGLEKLKRHSQSSPPPTHSAFSPKSSSPCPSDLSDASDDVIEEDKTNGHEAEPLVKRDSRERAEDVLKKTTQELDLSGSGAFDVVRASSKESDISDASRSSEDMGYFDEKGDGFSVHDKESGKEISGNNQGPQPVHEDFGSNIISPSYLPYTQSNVTARTTPLKTNEKANNDVDEEKEDTVLSFTLTRIMPQQFGPSADSSTTTTTSSTTEDEKHGIGKEQQTTGLKFTLTRIMPLQTCSSDVMVKEKEELMRVNEKKEEPGLQFTLTRIMPQETCLAEPAPPTSSTAYVNVHSADQSRDRLHSPQPLLLHDGGDNEGDSYDGPEEVFNRHLVLDNSSTKGQNEEASNNILTGVAFHVPGEENLQVAERGIAEVGGSGFSVSSPELRGESHLTSHTSEIGTNNNTPSVCAVSVEKPAESADGFLLSDNNGFGHGQLQDTHRDKFDKLCSDFESVLTISDPDETLVKEDDEKKEDEEDGQNDKEVEGIIVNSTRLKPKPEAESNGGNDLFSDTNISTDHLKLDQLSLTSPVVVEDTGVNEELEILSGVVGLEESKQTGPSSHGPVAKSSLDLAHQEGDNSMEWKFIDSRPQNEWGKSHEEDRNEGMEVEEKGEEGIRGPIVVRVVATAQLPRTDTDDETCDTHQRWRHSDQEIGFSQDGDAQIHQGFPVSIPIQHQFNNSDSSDSYRHDSQLSGIDSQSYDVRVSADQSDVIRTIDDDACFGNKQGRENQGSESVKNFEFGRSIEYSSIDGNLRGDQGISQLKKTNAQNEDGERQGTSETECLSHSTSDPASESRADTEASPLSQQVRRIHRKTVEETVTIERSSCKKSSRFANGRLEECDTRVEFITNRKETVIHKEDEVFTSSGPVAYVFEPTQQQQQQREKNVSSEDSSVHRDPESSTLSDIEQYSTFRKESTDPESPPLPSSPPPSQPLIITDTSLLTNTASSPLPPSIVPSPSENLHTSEMKWHDGLTHFPARSSFDQSLDPGVVTFTDARDKSTVIGAQRQSDPMKPANPVMHHSALDHLQAQLSQISDGSVFRTPSSPPYPPVYHDHGEATTHALKVNDEGSDEALHNMGRTNNTNGLDPFLQIPVINNNESGIPDQEIYDNDYDYITADKSRATHPNPRQHHLLKSGQVKASSLWTLKEETDSLLEGLSPISSPKRHFSNVTIDEKNENLLTTHAEANDKRNRNEYNDNIHWNSLHPSVSSALGHTKSSFESSDESDGNYSSISTTDSSSFRSSGYGREPTPLSDSDSGIPGDLGVDKIDYRDQAMQSQGQAVDGLRSFNDFVSGLESERLTSDWANKSHTAVSNTDSNQPSAIDFWDSPDAAPTTFKSSLAFCVSAAPPQIIPHHVLETSPRFNKDTHIQQSTLPVHQSSVNVPVFASTNRTRTLRIPAFPVEEDSLNTSSSASSSHFPADDTHNDASSRLYALDLDLSRISSCASPTPSDISDGSFFTCKGTAEIKKRHSVSFEDDYDMIPVPPSVPTSTPKPLKSVLKKPAKLEENQRQPRDNFDETWAKRFDKILEDFNNKTSTLGPASEVMVLENTRRPAGVGMPEAQGPNFNDLYKAFTNDDSEKKQNHICPVVEDDNMSTFRFKRFLKKSHTKRSKGRRLVRFLSRLSCVSESVQSPDLSAARKRAKLDNGQAYGTDFVPPPPERIHQPVVSDSLSFQHHAVLSNTKDSPTSSNHSLDSCHSRTDSAYSSVSESLSGVLNSPRNSSRLPNTSFSSVSSANGTFQQSDSSDLYYLDSVHSSTSDHSNLRPASETVDPFSPRPVSGKYSQEMLTALSDVFDQLDVCEGEIDTALLDRLRCGHQTVHFSKDA